MKSKPLRVPTGLPVAPYLQSSLILDGLTVVQSCTHVTGKTGSMFLEEHLLLFVLQGTYVIRYGKQEYTLGKNQMVLLKKAIVVEYDKSGDPENNNTSEFMMFFLKDDFLREFIRKVDLPVKQSDELSPISVKNVNQRLPGFIQSLTPYFREPDNNDLAYLSGRSPSSFKRDFQAIYNISPSRWIRERRLKKAKELLSNTELSVTDVCYMTGFENMSHFSKVYKSYYGHSPSSQRK